jgi:uncharacterized membrane protein YgdD (TMEM256/DUF423 family)
MNEEKQPIGFLTMTKETKVGVFFGALYLGVGIMLGAFAAHGLKDTLSEYQMGILQTGVKYQLIHGVALLILGLFCSLYQQYQQRLFYIALICVAVGVGLFSFSLYAIALLGISFIGIITPIGGVFMILGWVITMYAVCRNK